jgi:hypothetical protein
MHPGWSFRFASLLAHVSCAKNSDAFTLFEHWKKTILKLFIYLASLPSSYTNQNITKNYPTTLML